MKKFLFVFLISCFSLTIISCSDEKEESTTDTTAPVIAEVTAVTTPTNDRTPNYTFSSDEAGTIAYGGSCSSSTTSATSGNNTITFITLGDGTYSNCSIIVTDSAGNASNTLTITSFTVESTAPTVSSISPTDNQSGVSITDNISVTFSEAMDTTSVTTNTSNTTCSGSLQLSSDSFSTCVKMSSSPSVSNSDKAFTVDPTDNISSGTTYKIRVTTGVKDSAGNTLSSQYEQGNGYTIRESLGLDAVFHNGVYWEKEYTRIGTNVDGLTYCSDLDYAGGTYWQIPNYDQLLALYNTPHDNISVDGYLPFYPFSSWKSNQSTNKCGCICMTGSGCTAGVVYNCGNSSCILSSGWGTLCVSTP